MYHLENLESLRQDLTSEELLVVIYSLKVLKKLSESEEYNIPLFQNSDFNFNDFKEQLKLLDDNKDFYNIYSEISKIKNIEDSHFRTLLGIINSKEELPSIYEAFEYKEGLHTSVVSKQIVELSIKLLGDEKHLSIYVPFKDGLKVSELTDRKVYSEYHDTKKQFVVSLLNLSTKKEIVLNITNSLEEPSFHENSNLKQFDSVIAFPPLAMKGNFHYKEDRFNRFKIHENSKRLDVANFEHALSQTKNKAIVLMPVGFTFRSGIEQDFRKYLINNNFLDAIIQLPPNMYSATSVETTLFIINRNRNDNEEVLFINLKDEKFLTKIGRKTVLKDIDEIVDIYLNKKSDKNSIFVSFEEIRSNDYNFSIDRYLTQKQEIGASIDWVQLEKLALIRKAQTIQDVDAGENIVELSPSDFAFAGFTASGKKIKKINFADKGLETYRLKPYDILISAKGVVGKIAIVGENINYLLASQAIQIVRLEKVNDIKNEAICLYMYLKSDIGQKALMKIVQGTAMPQISTKELKKFEIPYLDHKKKLKIIDSFNEEIKILKKIQELQNKVSEIHTNYLV